MAEVTHFVALPVVAADDGTAADEPILEPSTVPRGLGSSSDMIAVWDGSIRVLPGHCTRSSKR
jgi:hypothetical protein